MFPPTDPSLTLANLTQLLQDAGNWNGVFLSLNIHYSVRDSIISQHSSQSERVKALGEWYLNNHPCPSWRHVAHALYEEKEHGVLEVLKSHYLKGESCGWNCSIITCEPHLLSLTILTCSGSNSDNHRETSWEYIDCMGRGIRFNGKID